MSGGRDATSLLDPTRAGDRDAFDRLVPLVYGELRAIAERLLRHERGAAALQPTDLVHETYIRLLDQHGGWHDRAHFLAVAAQMMRRVLVDDARARRTWKRGGAMRRVSLNDSMNHAETGFSLERVIEVDEALAALEVREPIDARIVELRCFGGLTIGETAAALRISQGAVKREWAVSKAWLARRLSATSAERASL